MAGCSGSDGSACGCGAPPADDPALDACSGGESFVLQVLGESMAPEFLDGEVIVIEPEGLARDGSFVLAWHREEWTFRQLVRAGDGWVLHALNPAWPDEALAGLEAVRGVVIQKAVPGRRRATRRFV